MFANRIFFVVLAISFFVACSDQGANLSNDLSLDVSIPDAAVGLDAQVVSDAKLGDIELPDVRIVDAGSDVSTPDAAVGLDMQAVPDASVGDIEYPDASEADAWPDALHIDMEVHTVCEEVPIEQGHLCYDGCDNDNDGLLDSLSPSCNGSCDGNNQFCPGGQICNVLAEKCEDPIPLRILFPDPGLCNSFPVEHPCHDLCNQLFLSGESCFWVAGEVVEVKDEDWDGVQDEPVVQGVPLDNCTIWHNPNQEDLDGNGVGDPCDLPREEQVDEDEDLIPDPYDNCVYAFNPVQEDSDADMVGDACSLGTGIPAADCGDGRPETQDQWNWQSQICESDFRDWNLMWVHLCHEDRQGLCSCPFPAPVQAGHGQTPVILNGWMCQVYADADDDGIPEAEDNLEGTYIVGFADNCPGVSNPDQVDSDGDGVGDACVH